MPKIDLEILGETFTVDYETRITSMPYPGRGADLYQPGEPPEPGEFEVDIISLRHARLHGERPNLEIPAWLSNRIEWTIICLDCVYREVFDARHDGPDPNAAYEAMRDEGAPF